MRIDFMGLHFEWDEKKARSNRKNHGVSFDEVKTVFVDPIAFIFDYEKNAYR